MNHFQAAGAVPASRSPKTLKEPPCAGGSFNVNAGGPQPEWIRGGARVYWLCGGVLLSRRVAPAVPSALAGLASGFGMGFRAFPRRHGRRNTVQHINQPCFSRSRGRGWGSVNRIVDARAPRPEGADTVCCLMLGCPYMLCVWGWVSPRPISTSPLNPLRGVHVRPINPVVCRGPYPL